MFEKYRTARCADQDAPGGGGTPSNAGGGAGTAVDVNELVNQVAGKRVKKEIARLMESLPSLISGAVKEAMGAKPADVTADKPAPTLPGNTAGGDQESKTLKEQLAELRRGFDAEKQARIRAEESARNMRVRSEVESHVMRHLGADSPNASLVMSHLLPQFLDKDGMTVRKAKDEYGAEQFIPAKDAVDELFKTDLKHLIAPQSKTGVLPPTGVARAMPGAGQQQAPRPNPIANVLAKHYESNGEQFQADLVRNAAATQGNGSK